MTSFVNSMLTPNQVENIRHFREDQLVKHSHLKRATVQSLKLIQSGRSIVMIVGSTGAGKTTLIDELESTFEEYSKTDPQFHSGRIPTITVVIDENQAYSWKTVWNSLLSKLDGFSINSRVVSRVDESGDQRRLIIVTTQRWSQAG